MIDYTCQRCGTQLDHRKILNSKISCGYCGASYDIKRDKQTGGDAMKLNESDSKNLGYRSSFVMDKAASDLEIKLLFRMMSRKLLFPLVLISLAFLAIGVTLLFFADRDILIMVCSIIVIVCSVFMTGHLPFWLMYKKSKNYKKRGGSHTNTVFKYDDFRTFISPVDGASAAETFRYESVPKVYESGGYVFIGLNRKQGFIMPLSAFGEQRESAVAFLKEKFGGKYEKLNSDDKNKPNKPQPPKKKKQKTGNYNRKAK